MLFFIPQVQKWHLIPVDFSVYGDELGMQLKCWLDEDIASVCVCKMCVVLQYIQSYFIDMQNMCANKLHVCVLHLSTSVLSGIRLFYV